MTVNFSSKNTYSRFINAKKDFPSGTSGSLIETEPDKIASVKVGDIDSEETKGSNHSHKKIFGIIGVSLGSGILLTLIGLFTLSKGFSAGFAKKFSRLSEQIKKTIAELTEQSKKLTPSQKLKLKVSKAIQPVAETMEASSNITAVKDSVTHHWLKKMHLEPVIKKINVFFKNNIVLKTKNNAYKNAELSTIDFCTYLEKIAKKENKPELAKKAKEILDDYSRHFSTINHYKRSDKAWESMHGLDDKVYEALFKKEGGFFKNIKQLKSYVTTDMIAKDRGILKKDLSAAQTKISDNLAQAVELVNNPEQKKAAMQMMNKMNTKLNHAIASEINSYEKLAELQVGSVPTDILGILAPSAIATGLIINSDNKSERISTTLTKGIPILGGIGVSYYGTTRGFTGAKNLILGLATGALLNVIGTKTDEIYKKYVEKQNLLKTAFEAFNKLQLKQSAEKTGN